MSQTEESGGGPPSNSELAQRTVRIEEQVEHVAATVDRIEDRVVDDQESIVEDQQDIATQVEENSEKVGTLWTAYRLARWGIPVTGTLMGSLAAVGLL